jgi:hypothetical protein
LSEIPRIAAWRQHLQPVLFVQYSSVIARAHAHLSVFIN